MKQKLIKMVSLVMVLNILIIPLSSFMPGEYIKSNKVEAAVAVDVLFFTAILSAIAYTAVNNHVMSDSFAIPKEQINKLKDNFQATLNSNPDMARNFYNTQTDYLAGGASMVLTATSLYQLGLPTIFELLKTYLTTAEPTVLTPYVNNIIQLDSNCYIERNQAIPEGYVNLNYLSDVGNTIAVFDESFQNNNNIIYNYASNITTHIGEDNFYKSKLWYGNDYIASCYISQDYSKNVHLRFTVYASAIANPQYADYYDKWIKQLYADGIAVTDTYAITNAYTGTLTGTDDLVGETDESIPIVPVLPWITDISSGVIADPAITFPAGTVPIDVPTDIPVEDNPSLFGTIAAILAGILPISGLLDNIDAGIDAISGTVTDAITDVIDNIGAIPGEITDILSGTLASIIAGITGISTAINDFVFPQPENVSELNLDPIKNLPAVLFSRFPFSIPFDFYNIMLYMGGTAREAPVFEFTIPLSSIGQTDVVKSINMQLFDFIAVYVRMAELIAFAIAVMLKTKTLVWG